MDNPELCDRNFPCSNCRARRLPCVSAAGQPDVPSSQPIHSFSAGSSSQGIEELNARLKRLEELLEKNINVSGSSKDTASVSTQETPAKDAQITNTVSWLESDAFEHRGLHESTNNNLLCYDDEITQTFAASFLGTSATTVRTGVDAQSLRSLPSRKHARVLFDYFIDNIVWIYHIIHIPTLESHLNGLYDDLDQNLQPQSDHVALLSAVFALSVYFQGAEPLSETRRWTLLAQKALCAANFIGKPTVESIQAVLLIAQHLLPNIGGIATFRVLFTTAMHSARSLGFDQLDSTQSKKRRLGKELNYVELETKRRIWWHIYRIMSFMSGPQSGTYMIHPQQMKCDYPSNVNDVDIGPPGDYKQPTYMETDMTYSTFRYQLSIICREIVDAMQDLSCEIHELPYETVLNFDRKLISMVSEIPPAFRMDAKSRAQHKNLDAKHPFLAVQRTAGHFGVQTRFTRIHRPYLARGAHDPRFSYSRMVCLRSARSVIELGTELTDWGKKQNFQPFRMWTVTHHIFVATVILVMDFCLNKDDPRSEERKAEIMDAFKMLESCQETSTIARRGLEQLRDILRRGASSTEEALAEVQNHRDAARDASSSINSSKQRHSEFRMPEPMAPFPGLNINDPCSRVDWENVDFDTIEDINFDTDFSASDFEALFHNEMAPQCG
ncbi:putative c6 zinc finger domain-containing protein [Botrytis fragariae]|uniref:Putative c6 zinc finger domain-containing protein n=1 Tax=Botrytis fragariae TaxID=1964551 RepID=A0A8H6ED87_9HELO|nr:putative c6 zinc finger domain-containing protein [Botrytis fragariae]KAF5867961.1 putative c6 zinc finger domain-containing protein [Botrytis fragariae]